MMVFFLTLISKALNWDMMTFWIFYSLFMKVPRISDLLLLGKIGHLERRGDMKLLTKEICLPAPSKGCQLNPKGW